MLNRTEVGTCLNAKPVRGDRRRFGCLAERVDIVSDTHLRLLRKISALPIQSGDRARTHQHCALNEVVRKKCREQVAHRGVSP